MPGHYQGSVMMSNLLYLRAGRASAPTLLHGPGLFRRLRRRTVADRKPSIRGARAHGRTPPGSPTLNDRVAAARSAGEKLFDPGIPCVRGHVSLRHTSSRQCIACGREAKDEFKRDHPEAHRARSLAAEARRPDRKEKKRQWWARVGEARNEKVRRRYAADPTVKDRQSRWRQANPDRSRAYAKRWRDNNPDAVRRNNRIGEATRRAREQGAAVGDRRAYRAYVAWAKTSPSIRCYWCKVGTKPGRKTRHIDHIIPLAKGGADSVANLCVACPTCNLTKSAKMPVEFAGQSELSLA